MFIKYITNITIILIAIINNNNNNATIKNNRNKSTNSIKDNFNYDIDDILTICKNVYLQGMAGIHSSQCSCAGALWYTLLRFLKQ